MAAELWKEGLEAAAGEGALGCEHETGLSVVSVMTGFFLCVCDKQRS